MYKSLMTALFISTTSFAFADVEGDRAAYSNVPFDQTQPDIAVFQDYLNAMNTLTGDFRQAGSNGQVYTGKLHLSRPWRMRLNYNPPSPLLIVADGEWLITYDKELDETNYVSLENTPAEFILRPHINFSEDVHVLEIIPRADNTTAITFAKKGNEDEGQITLVFENNPVALKEWTVTDGQGQETHVTLTNLKLNPPVSGSLFKFNKPNLAEKLF